MGLSVDRSKVGALIDSLPLELLFQIARYLDPEDIVRCHRVRLDHPSSFEPFSSPNRNRPRFRSDGVRFSQTTQS